MPVGSDTFATRRHLPHLQRPGKTYFVTFATDKRALLEPRARDIALECCVHNHERAYWLFCAVIMPDHVHMILRPYDQWTLPRVLRRVKGVSSRLINLSRHQRGPVWQAESFDRVLRSSEDARKKADYTCQNPVRAGLVSDAEDYPWKWRLWLEGK